MDDTKPEQQEIEEMMDESSQQLEQQKNTWKLKLQGNGDLMLERWALEKRQRLFQDVFGVKFTIME